MNSKKLGPPVKIVFASLGLLLSCNALGESLPITYKYGAKLDIVKVLSMSTEYTPVCKPVDRIMKYIDSSGKTRALKYRVLSAVCSSGRG
ncbi:DUF2790 domain-containing protein [Halopseudomonas bauzanensis]|uniref:DUF2790 domain-containing protein n=1 Tax=Halopseudomonas bauzanensis TaxID=653930 RepID=A0A4U0YKV4_9GAMM|nr:DUF2790 domain-containing protein [Halopseudomonas bauzanensis]TKA90111.1 DUF2790 domain-containing protein [Halopseudomonas bauzanensis]